MQKDGRHFELKEAIKVGLQGDPQDSFKCSLQSHLSDFSRSKGIREIDVAAGLSAHH